HARDAAAVRLPGRRWRVGAQRWSHAGNAGGQTPSRHADPGRSDWRPRRPRSQYANRRRQTAMMNPIRQELLAVLAELSVACPEMRFGQLIANLSTLARRLSAEGLWDAEDEDLLAAARKQLAYFAEHRSLVT